MTLIPGAAPERLGGLCDDSRGDVPACGVRLARPPGPSLTLSYRASEAGWLCRFHRPRHPPPTPVARPALWSGSPPESAELLVQPTLAAAELGAQPPPRPAQPHTPIPQSAWARLTSGRPRPCGGLGSEPSSEAVDEI